MTRVVLAAHGTADPAGRSVLEVLRRSVAARLPTADVVLGYVDVCRPHVTELLDAGSPTTVVPLFLTAGYHVRVDLPRELAGHPHVRLTGHLGAAAEVVDALSGRLAAVRSASGPVVLVAAGSSDRRAGAEAGATAVALARAVGRPVTTAVLSGPGPAVGQAVSAARDRGEEPVLASYLLAPGHFHDRLARLGTAHGVAHSEPIGAHPAVVDLVVRRVSPPADRPLPTTR